MKKAILPLAIASLVATPAFADVTVYGKAWVSFQHADVANAATGTTPATAPGTYTELRNNESRLGVKGSETIDDDLKAIYQYEFKVNPDNGSTPFAQRNIFVGLQGNFGTIQAGQFDTPLKLAQEKTDVFKDMQGDWKLILPGELRSPNIIQYSTTAMHNVTANIAYITGETAQKGYYKDGYSASLVYNTKPFYVALASDHNANNVGKAPVIANNPYDADIYRLVTRFTLGKVVLGAMYQTSTASVDKAGAVTVGGHVDTNGDFIHHNGYNLSGIYNVNDTWALKAQFTSSDALDVKQAVKHQGRDTYKATDAQMVSVGVDYALNKKVKLHAYYTTWSDDNSIKLDKHDDKFLGTGMEISF